MLSVCIIAKNEERWMGEFLAHLRSYVEEVIVVDTGSSDRTAQIALEMGAKVFHHVWQDDFSLARNFSISQATSPWILVLDPDERIAAEDWRRLKDLLCSSDVDAYIFETRNYTENLLARGFRPVRGEHPIEEKEYPGYFGSRKTRLFRNFAGIHFVGRVHELVEPTLTGKISVSTIPIHHYGSTKEALEAKQKKALYRSLTEQKVKDNPNDWKAHYELGVVHLELGDQASAVLEFEKAKEGNPEDLDVLQNLALAYLETRQFEKCDALLKDILTRDPQNYDALYNASVLEIRRQDLNQGVKKLLSLLKAHPDSFVGFRILGLCFLAADQKEPARKCFEESLKICPSYQEARANLELLDS
jgi:hypothetical protein